MAKKSILLFLLILNALLACNVKAQNSIEQKMGDYLVKSKEIDSAIYTVKVRSNKQELITNFYVDKLLEIMYNESEIVFYKFGSYTEHQRPHFALIRGNDLSSICFVDCINVEKGLYTLLDFFKSSEASARELEIFKIKVIKYYINGFPAASNVN